MSYLGLLLIVIWAAYLRLRALVPVERGLQFLQDYDEAVWDTTAQLMLQGHLPYRDFFATLPPVGIYLLAAVLRLVNVPWGSGASFMATRYASVVYGLATVVTVYLLGCRLAGRATGLVAAALLAVDGMVIGMDRRAMLEPPLNLLSALAVLVYLHLFEQAYDDNHSRKLAMLVGFLSALAALVKTPGMLVVFALITTSLLRRRFREAVIIAVGFGLSWVVLSAYFLFQCPDELLKQVYFFQLLRPADGVVHRTVRLLDIWHYSLAWLTVRAGSIGALFLGLLTLARREARSWLIVLTWAGYVLALIIVNGSYWPQYYVQLAVPLSLLGGGLLDRRIAPVGRYAQGVSLRIVPLVLILMVGLVTGKITAQYSGIMRMVERISPVYNEMADYLRQNTLPQDRILVFEPNYTFLSSRSPAGMQSGHFLVDSYGEMLYVNLGIPEGSLWQLAETVLTGKKDELQRTFWRAPAQERVLTAFEQAEYVVIDGRARYQLKPQTLTVIKARSSRVFMTGVASLWKRD